MSELVHDPDVIDLLAGVADEMLRQDGLWGEQNHPDGTGLLGDREAADSARRTADRYAEIKALTWRDILTEEYHEALAETDPEKLKEELLQVAAVAIKWAQAVDRRNQ